jgi:hypothetical protein
MKKYLLIISSLIVLAVFAAGCRSGASLTSTPVPTVAGAPILAPQVPLLTLVRQPASFSNQFIEVTGQYEPLPSLVCGGEVHRSPASWLLTSGEIAIPVSGFASTLRRLADSGLSLTVQGRWQFWEGAVGCGRRAPLEQLWYLEATAIVSPNPLVREESGGQPIVVVPSPTAESEGGELPPSVPTATAPGDQNGQGTPIPPGTVPTPTGPLPTSTPTIQSVPTATASPTFGPGGVTITPSPTLSMTTTVTPTTTPGDDTATETATVEGAPDGTPQPSNQGVMNYDDLKKGELATGTTHSWGFTAAAGNVVIISAAAAQSLDVRLEVVSPTGSVLVTRNEAAAGRPETTGALTLAEAGDYLIIVSPVGTSSGHYAVALQDSGSMPRMVFRETINYGANRSGLLAQGEDHLWGFMGAANDTITVRATPGSGFDLVLYILGPDGVELIYVDDGEQNAEETLVGYQLPESGFYTIAVGELEFREASYTITLQRE